MMEETVEHRPLLPQGKVLSPMDVFHHGVQAPPMLVGKMKCSFITFSMFFRFQFQAVYHFSIENSDYSAGAIIIRNSTCCGFLLRFSIVYNY